MMSIVGMNANNLDTKRGIHRDFLATHPLVFADATDPLEANSWLHTMESKFGLIHYIKYQKTLYAT
jgi:hypothetical protein